MAGIDYTKEYADFLRKFLDVQGPVRAIFDPSNGTTGLVLERVFEGVESVDTSLINDRPDGDFPAHGPNPLLEGATDDLSSEVKEEQADVGAVFDSDGDRVFFLDEQGAVISAYDVFLCIKDFFKAPYVLDVRALASFTMPEINIVEEKVGRRYIVDTMHEHKAGLGAEYSGHYYFDTFFYSDAGILAAIFMLNYVSRLQQNSQTLSEAIAKAAPSERLPEVNFEIHDIEGALRRLEEHYGRDKTFKIDKLDGISVFGGDFAFNVRPSNTEPVVRLNIAAKNKKILDGKLTEVKKVMEVDE